MDLNKAMVDLYKQRSSASKQKALPNKGRRQRDVDQHPNQSVDSTNKMNTSSLSVPPESREARKRNKDKIDEFIAQLDFKPKSTFDQLHGIQSVREKILSVVNRFQRFIDGKAKKSGWPILICGSRGLGKTSLVEAAANYANLNMIPIPLVHMVEQTRNEFKESLEQLIRHSISIQPAIVLIDDLEQISEKEEHRYLVRGAIRRLLDEQHKLLIFCTTSSTLEIASDIDFLFTIQLMRPSLEARYKILESLREANKNLAYLTDDMLQVLAINTPSFTAMHLRKMLDIAETESDNSPTMKHCDEAIEVVKQSFKRGTHLIGEKPAVTWDDIGGLPDVRQAFADILRQTKRGGRNCKFAGIALYGPPGCGKTMVAQAMANEGGFNFISIKPAELVDKFLGETEKNIRRVFHEAREHEPCMIYFDEFDGLCGTRGNKDTITSAIQTLLSEMDGFVNRGQSIILASTNRLEDIDPAMKRPGRLSKHIYVGPPDEKARRDILEVITSKSWISLSDDVNLDEWARDTDYFTGAELDFLVAEAEARAYEDFDNKSNSQQGARQIENGQAEFITLKQEHFEYAINKIRATNRELDKKTRKRSKLE